MKRERKTQAGDVKVFHGTGTLDTPLSDGNVTGGWLTDSPSDAPVDPARPGRSGSTDAAAADNTLTGLPCDTQTGIFLQGPSSSPVHSRLVPRNKGLAGSPSGPQVMSDTLDTDGSRNRRAFSASADGAGRTLDERERVAALDDLMDRSSVTDPVSRSMMRTAMQSMSYMGASGSKPMVDWNHFEAIYRSLHPEDNTHLATVQKRYYRICKNQPEIGTFIKSFKPNRRKLVGGEGQPWTEEETSLILKAIEEGANNRQIIGHLHRQLNAGRKPSAIDVKIRELRAELRRGPLGFSASSAATVVAPQVDEDASPNQDEVEEMGGEADSSGSSDVYLSAVSEMSNEDRSLDLSAEHEVSDAESELLLEASSAVISEAILSSFCKTLVTARRTRPGEWPRVPIPIDPPVTDDELRQVDHLVRLRTSEHITELGQRLWAAATTVVKARPARECEARIKKQRLHIAYLEETLKKVRRRLARTRAELAFVKGELSCGARLKIHLRWLGRQQDETYPSNLHKVQLEAKIPRYCAEIAHTKEELNHAKQRLTEMIDRATFEGAKHPTLAADSQRPSRNQADEFYSKLVGEKADLRVIGDRVGLIEQWAGSQTRLCRMEAKATISADTWNAACKKVKPWKAPGPDGLHAFWWKKVPAARQRLLEFANASLNGRLDLPPWFTMGRTVLIYKKGAKHDVANYRPITCLNTAYKLITSAIAMTITDAIKDSDVWNPCQRALVKGQRGCAHALLTDLAVQAYCQSSRGPPLSVAWFDYTKAFDSTPHELIHSVLEVIHVSDGIRAWLRRVMCNWRTRIEIPGESSIGKEKEKGKVIQYYRGVFQGDSLSPLLFCLSMLPIQHALDVQCRGVSIPTRTGHWRITHQLYVDDLKVYAGSARDLAATIEVVKTVSECCGYSLGLAKCNQAHAVKPTRNQYRSGCIEQLAAGDYYTYLGIPQQAVQDWKKVFEDLTAKILGKCNGIFKSGLTWSQMLVKYNQLIPPIIRYSVEGGLTMDLKLWQKLDMEIRRILCAAGLRTRSASKYRPYLPWENAGLGMTSCELSYKLGCIGRSSYLDSHVGDIQVVKEILQQYGADNGVLAYEGQPSEVQTDNEQSIALMGDQSPTGHTRVVDVAGECIRRQRALSKKAKAEYHAELLGKFLETPCAATINLNHEWACPSIGAMLRKGNIEPFIFRDLVNTLEGQLMLATHSSKYSATNSGKATCSSCGEDFKCGNGVHDEIAHILSVCKANHSHIKRRHDEVAIWVYHFIAKNLGSTERHPEFGTHPPPVQSLPKGTLKWDYHVVGMRQGSHCKPDIIVETRDLTWVIEVAVCKRSLHSIRYQRKREKYLIGYDPVEYAEGGTRTDSSLACYLERQTRRPVKVVPVVVGTLGEQPPLNRKHSLSPLLDLVGSRSALKELAIRTSSQAAYHSVQMIRKSLGSSEPVEA